MRPGWRVAGIEGCVGTRGAWVMQRKDIDEVGFAILETELADKQVLPGNISVVIGRHDVHGRVILVQAADLYLALADDADSIVGLNEPIEPA
jgi:hypothetical protein